LGRFAADIEFSAWRGGFPGLVALLRKRAGIRATPMCRKTGSERIIIIAGMIRNAAAARIAGFEVAHSSSPSLLGGTAILH